jgi:hypothetical protein
MRILVLDGKNHITENISRHQGTINSSLLRTSETYRPAVSPNGPSILFATTIQAATRRSCPKISLLRNNWLRQDNISILN